MVVPWNDFPLERKMSNEFQLDSSPLGYNCCWFLFHTMKTDLHGPKGPLVFERVEAN